MDPCGPCFWGCFLLLSMGHTLRECQGFSAPALLPMDHLPHVEQYEVVQPLRLPISGALNEFSSSPTLYPETIRYHLGLRDNNFTLHLRRNRYLVGSDYTETYTSANGTQVTEKPQVGQHCYYQGHVEGHQNSIASVSTCLGIRGFFKTGSTIHLIEPLDRKKYGSSPERHGRVQRRHSSSQESYDSTIDKGYNSDQENYGSPHVRYGVIQGKYGGNQVKQDKYEGTTQSGHASHEEKYKNPERHKNDQGQHVIYKQQDLKEQIRICGVSKVSLKGELKTMMAVVPMPPKWIPESIPKDTHYVELFVVVDYKEYKKYKNVRRTRQRVKEIINHVDRLYQEINFRVVLIGLEIWDKRNKVTIDSNIESTLSSFLKWRNSELLKKKKHDNAQLITGETFDGNIVGLARLASMCKEGSGGVTHDYSTNPFAVAYTMAHEMGHNLGMDHDDNVKGCRCEDKRSSGCIMASQSGEFFPKKFSSCSKLNLQKFLIGNIFSSSCLNNFPTLEQLKGGPVCGNKFLEQGEECDCGSPEECLNRCCNPKNCRLAQGAECTEGECCQGCQVMPAGEVCREAQSSCDLTEYCNGKQPACPENVYKENGTPCRRGYCYNGICPTYKQQCQALWGRGAKVSPDKCFLLKLPKGCTEGFYPSTKGLNKCRNLFCNRANTKQSTRHLCSYFLAEERCDLAITKGESRHPFEMVASGTKCGKKKVCHHRRCQDLSIYGTQNCSSKCHKRGICNHKRECHCDPGWAPPNCQEKILLPEMELSEELMNQQRVNIAHKPPFQLSTKSRSVLVAVLVSLILMAMLAILVFFFYKWKMKKKEGILAPSQP